MAETFSRHHRLPLDNVCDWYETRNPDLLAETIDWRVLESFPDGGRYRGRAAVLDSFIPAVKERFSRYETRPEQFFVEGSTVIVTGTYHIEGRSGRRAEVAFAHIWTVQDGELKSLNQIADTAMIAFVLN